MAALVLIERNQFRYIEDMPDSNTEWPAWEVYRVGICRTDVNLTHNPARTNTVLGHEVVCRDGHGQYYALNNEINCGECDYCLEGKTSHCRHMRELGVNEHGGFASKIHALANNLVPFTCTDHRIGVLIEPLACAIHGIKRLDTVLNTQPEIKVLVQGSGISGKLITYLLHTLYPALELTLYDVQADAMAWAESYPAIQRITEILQEHFHVAIECSGSQQGLADCFHAVRRGGILMIYGVPLAEATFSFSPNELMTREINLVTSLAGCDRETFCQSRDTVVAHQPFFSTLLGKTIGLKALEKELLHFSPILGTKTLVDPLSTI
ncbi:zinc-binding dehydrogenase [Xenorhabdus bovienii]|uniref:Putative L-iditol 2-dehydrogenase n=1 Tax=Xenorhabdus bovienii TaxID=40576 RepID=A0A0B6X8Q6_XENBV|nr:alcohol dehydrogenase catalytic domain-containing protein [Xenorhabdus bovienii]CDM89945.1 putative L-iditol 2-dehydrogenase [Xenorhabdus bovienii]